MADGLTPLPALTYVCVTFSPVAEPPSEKSHLYEMPPDMPLLNVNVVEAGFGFGATFGSGPGVSGPPM